MFEFFKRRKATSSQNSIPFEKAKEIIEAEVQRREWQSYGLRRYSLERRDGKMIWHCYAMPPHIRGPGMTIDIDATTGEVIHAVAEDRPPS